MWNWPAGAPSNPNRALRVFSTPPNWKNGVLETLSWMTDIMSSENGTEQRRGSRRFPRRVFELGYMRAGANRSRIDNFLSAIGRAPFMLPLWHDQFTLPEGTGSNTVTFPEGTLAMREFYLNELVMITALDPGTYDVLTVVGVSGDTITLAGDGTTLQWAKGSRIVPLRRAMLTEFPKLTSPADRVGQAQLRFTLMDADTNVVPSWGYCAPIFKFKPDRAEAIDVDYFRSDFMLDFDAGVVDVTDTGERAQVVQAMAMKFFGRENVFKFRQFIYMARGRAVRFYCPSFTYDVVPSADMFGATFDAYKNGFFEYQQVPQEARRILAVVFKDARPTIYRAIESIEPVLDTAPPYRQIGERFTLEQDMPPILKNDVERIMFMMPARFDQDTIEIAHAVAGSYAVSSSLVVRSSVVEGMPPIDCWVTSRVYPIESVDTMTASFGITSVSFREPPAPIDNMVHELTFTAGELRSVLLGYGIDPENVTNNLSFTAGEIRALLLGYAMDPENLIDQLSFTAGSIKKVLIQYTMEPETLGNTLAITEGSLT